MRTFLYHCREGATISHISELLEKEAINTLEKVEQFLPQYNLDGTRNIWIVKPGDKSKGIGQCLTLYCVYMARWDRINIINETHSPRKNNDPIVVYIIKKKPMHRINHMTLSYLIIGIEFLDDLDEIMKYISNSTIQGTYVLQKYVG